MTNWITEDNSRSRTSALEQVIQTLMRMLGSTTKLDVLVGNASVRSAVGVLSTVWQFLRLNWTAAMRRAVIVAVVIVAVAATATACGESQADPSPSSKSSAPTGPSSTPPAWESNYDETQLGWYDEALRTWQEYDERTADIWATGEATPAAKQLFATYLVNPDKMYQQLRTLEASKITSKGTPTVYWTRAKAVTPSGDTGKHSTVVEIEQCEDLKPVTSYQNGEPVKPITPRDHPVIQDISVMRVGKIWKISAYEVPQKAKECDPAMP